MFKIIEKVAKVFETAQAKGLEEYIISKNPQSNADIEKLTREYETQPKIWARGL